MSYTITDQNIYNEIQMHLLETANNGASYGSGLFSVAEVVGRLNFRLKEFAKLTGCVTKRDNTVNSQANQNPQAVPTDAIDIVRVAYPDTNGDLVPIPKSTHLDADLTVTDITSTVDVPLVWSLDTAAVNTINFLPAPNAVRAIDYIYVVEPTTLPATPDGTVLDMPDDFTPYIKYGVLADLWSKAGETHDPMRAAMCAQIYALGVEIGRAWASGRMFD